MEGSSGGGVLTHGCPTALLSLSLICFSLEDLLLQTET